MAAWNEVVNSVVDVLDDVDDANDVTVVKADELDQSDVYEWEYLLNVILLEDEDDLAPLQGMLSWYCNLLMSVSWLSLRLL